MIVVSEPEELMNPTVRAILKALTPLISPSEERSRPASSLVIVANAPSYSTTSARNALLSSYERALERSLADSGSRVVYNDKVARRVKIQIVSSEAAIDSQAVFRRDQLTEALTSSSSPSSSSPPSSTSFIPSPTTYAQSVSRFQSTLLDSGLPDLSKSLQITLSSVTPAAFTVSSAALQRVYASIHKAQKEVDRTEGVVSHLRHTSINTARQYEAFPSSSPQNFVSGSRLRNTMKIYLNGTLKWWKLPWRVDELGSEVGSIVRVEFGRELERTMVFATGKLEAVKERLDSSATAAVTPSSSPLFHSPILLNELNQLSTSAHELTPTTLLPPISSRLHQLTSSAGSPLTHLHYRAQRVLLQGYAISLGGPVASLGMYVYHGSSGGEEVALAISVLSVVGGMRWVVGGWEKAKRRWWESLGRIEEGLERDLKVCYFPFDYPKIFRVILTDQLPSCVQ